jgi:phosphoribosylformylglycinamidine (FGAM) synthase PurS component
MSEKEAFMKRCEEVLGNCVIDDDEYQKREAE